MKRYLVLVLLVLPLISCTSGGLLEKPRVLSGSWAAKDPAKLQLRFIDQRQVEAEFFVHADQQYQKMEPGMAYIEEIDGKPIGAWSLVGDGKPCMVSVSHGSGFLTLPDSVSFSPDRTTMARVEQPGDAGHWLQISGCQYSAKMMWETKKDKERRIYRVSNAGTLKVKGLYRQAGKGQWEVFVELPSGQATQQVVLAQLREAGPALIVAANGTYLPADVRYEREP